MLSSVIGELETKGLLTESDGALVMWVEPKEEGGKPPLMVRRGPVPRGCDTCRSIKCSRIVLRVGDAVTCRCASETVLWATTPRTSLPFDTVWRH
jgi:hypothetical protein